MPSDVDVVVEDVASPSMEVDFTLSVLSVLERRVGLGLVMDFEVAVVWVVVLDVETSRGAEPHPGVPEEREQGVALACVLVGIEILEDVSSRLRLDTAVAGLVVEIREDHVVCESVFDDVPRFEVANEGAECAEVLVERDLVHFCASLHFELVDVESVEIRDVLDFFSGAPVREAIEEVLVVTVG